MRPIRIPLVGLYDPRFARLCFLIAILAAYVALNLAASVTTARGEVRCAASKLKSPSLGSDRIAASIVYWNRAIPTQTLLRPFHWKFYPEPGRDS